MALRSARHTATRCREMAACSLMRGAGGGICGLNSREALGVWELEAGLEVSRVRTNVLLV